MRFLRQQRLRAPEIEPVGWAGDALFLGELKSRIVLLDFFSFGDPEGVRALGRIRRLGDHYRDVGLTVLGIHVPAYEFERPLEPARQEIWRLGIPYPVALDHAFDVYRAYDNRDLPARWLVDERRVREVPPLGPRADPDTSARPAGQWFHKPPCGSSRHILPSAGCCLENRPHSGRRR